MTVYSDTKPPVVHHRSTGEIVASDPSQTAASLTLDLEAGTFGTKAPGFEAG